MVLASSAATARVVGKSDLVAALSKLTTVKGKYEQELRFSFIQENVKLVPEDLVSRTACAIQVGPSGVPPQKKTLKYPNKR
eukprot:6257626-Amphidinium_carterae.1